MTERIIGRENRFFDLTTLTDCDPRSEFREVNAQKKAKEVIDGGTKPNNMDPEHVLANKSELYEQEIARAKDELLKSDEQVKKDVLDGTNHILGKVNVENKIVKDTKNAVAGALGTPGVTNIMRAFGAKDPVTRDHAIHSATLMTVFAISEKQDKGTVTEYALAGYVHDTGKLGVHRDVLCKQGPLTDDERAAINTHPEQGKKILEGVGYSGKTDVVSAAYEHQERDDGSGYPRGLKAGEISYLGKVAGVVDFLAALLADRPYRPGMPLEKAMGILNDAANKGQIDKVILEKVKKSIGFSTK